MFSILLTLMLIIFTFIIGASLVSEGSRNFLLRQQRVMVDKNLPILIFKSVSLILAGLLLILPSFFTDLLGLLLLFPPVQNYLMLKLLPYLYFNRVLSCWFNVRSGNVFEGEYQRKNDE